MFNSQSHHSRGSINRLKLASNTNRPFSVPKRILSMARAISDDYKSLSVRPIAHHSNSTHRETIYSRVYAATQFSDLDEIIRSRITIDPKETLDQRRIAMNIVRVKDILATITQLYNDVHINLAQLQSESLSVESGHMMITSWCQDYDEITCALNNLLITSSALSKERDGCVTAFVAIKDNICKLLTEGVTDSRYSTEKRAVTNNDLLA